MTVIPFVHEGLGNSSYLVGTGDGNALLIDPDRSIGRYLATASARGWTINHVFETHLHADFVSGSLEVRAAIGAELFVPEAASVRFPHRPVQNGDSVGTGRGEVSVIASPGHTPEHCSYVFDLDGTAPTLFSGGSMLVGGAARTDLISPDMTAALTASQYRTITAAFKHLPDETLLMPTHGGGSFCSTGGGGERTSTLGLERRTNPLLTHEDEAEFVSWFPTTFPAAPRYFFRLRPINQTGPRLRSSIRVPRPLPAAEFDQLRAQAAVIDLRPQADYMAGHIPGAISNTFRDAFATWLGWLIPEDAPLLFVLGEEPIERVLDECLLVGYERFAGVLAGGMPAWEASGLEVLRDDLVDANEAGRLVANGATVVDVREANEFAEGHVPGAVHIPLGALEARSNEISSDRPVVTYCGHGERSATALSLLERLGFGSLANLDGGIGAWQEAGLEVER